MPSLHLFLLLKHWSFNFQHGAHSNQQSRQNRTANPIPHFIDQAILDHGRNQLGNFFRNDASASDRNLGKTGLRAQNFQLHNSEEKRIFSDDFPNVRRLYVSFRHHCHLLHFYFPKSEDDWQKSQQNGGQNSKQPFVSAANSHK